MKTKETIQKDEKVTLKSFLAMAMADIDIFLLKDETKKKDNDKLYTKEEIRNQLHKTMDKFSNIPNMDDRFYKVPLFEALSDKVLEMSGLSKATLKRYKEQQKNN